MKLAEVKGNFRAVFHRFANGKGKTYRDGDWRVSVGGYDLWFEIYIKDEWVIRCVNGDLDWRKDIFSGLEIEKLLQIIIEEYPGVNQDY